MDIFKEEVKDLTSKFDEVKFDHMREIETVKADEVCSSFHTSLFLFLVMYLVYETYLNHLKIFS